MTGWKQQYSKIHKKKIMALKESRDPTLYPTDFMPTPTSLHSLKSKRGCKRFEHRMTPRFASALGCKGLIVFKRPSADDRCSLTKRESGNALKGHYSIMENLAKYQ
jgi:hypothetical protein